MYVEHCTETNFYSYCTCICFPNHQFMNPISKTDKSFQWPRVKNNVRLDFIRKDDITWALAWENRPSDKYTQRRLKSVRAAAQSDQSLHCPHHSLSKMRPVKILIICAVWSESSLGAHIWRHQALRLTCHSKLSGINTRKILLGYCQRDYH